MYREEELWNFVVFFTFKIANCLLHSAEKILKPFFPPVTWKIGFNPTLYLAPIKKEKIANSILINNSKRWKIRVHFVYAGEKCELTLVLPVTFHWSFHTRLTTCWKSRLNPNFLHITILINLCNLWFKFWNCIGCPVTLSLLNYQGSI